MKQPRDVYRWSVGALLLAAFLGCAVPAPTGDPQLGINAQPGSPDAAKRDLSQLLKQRIGIKYHGLPGINDLGRRSELTELLKGPNNLFGIAYESGEVVWAKMDSLSVFEDRIEVSPRVAFFFQDLVELPVTVVNEPKAGSNPHVVHFEGRISFFFDDFADAQRFAEDLRVIQRHVKNPHEERMASFEAKAAEYRSLKVKPPVSEEQRRLIVQANAMGQRKEYARAIDLYLKAVDMDPVSYPAAYFNLGLLSAQVNRFGSAITYMKQYLLLEPDAKDARGAQDKIYEWELMIKN